METRWEASASTVQVGEGVSKGMVTEISRGPPDGIRRENRGNTVVLPLEFVVISRIMAHKDIHILISKTCSGLNRLSSMAKGICRCN